MSAGNSFGDGFRVTTFGESHGAALGAVVDGCPAGLNLCPNDFIHDMQRRRPGYSPATSSRKESDEVQILSGVFEGLTLGTSIALIIQNIDQKPEDYAHLKEIFREGHGDFTYMAKYGIRDHRGGGRASGRESAARVAAGVIAKKILTELNVSVASEALYCKDALSRAVSENDSIGSTVICTINGLKAGIGQPVFGKLDAALAGAVMSIGGTRAVEFGLGKKTANLRASEHNPIDKGILAGISDGEPILITATFKAPPTINMGGRHDPVLAPRAQVAVEAMVAITLVNHIFASFSDTVQSVKRSYNG
ncbi:MAG: chorismate synthase [Defluviitaleaceae bacterium]|nr:chorismate synthase [Defluviitaleaceae bacterium]